MLWSAFASPEGQSFFLTCASSPQVPNAHVGIIVLTNTVSQLTPYFLRALSPAPRPESSRSLVIHRLSSVSCQ